MTASDGVMKTRKKLATDLRKLSDVLTEYFPTADFGSFESARNELLDKENIPHIPQKPSNSDLWGYTLSQIIFKFDNPPRHTLPKNCVDLKLILDIKAIGNSGDFGAMTDPFEWLEFNIVIEGTKFSSEKKPIQLATSYHLDRHISSETDGESEYPHPLYHFQFGGRKLTEQNNNFDTGDLLIFDSPRILHFPLEAVLGIDFTISNFFPQIWFEITSKSNEYLNLIEEYQKIFLKPYIHTHASHWPFLKDNLMLSKAWKPQFIHPQIK